MRTRAKRDGDDWVLNGTKMWITNGSVADVAVVWARPTNRGADAEGRHYGAGASAASSCPPTPPVSPPATIAHKLSLRASVTSELVLEDVRLPADAVLREVTGLARAAVLSERGPVRHRLRRAGRRPGLPGDGDRVRGTREVFDRPLAAFQLTQAKLADMTLELQKGFLLAMHLGRLKDDHRLDPRQVSLGKLNNVREALAIARECRTILGASGITWRVPGDAARQQPGVGADLRGHLRGAPAGHRPGPDRGERVRLSQWWTSSARILASVLGVHHRLHHEGHDQEGGHHGQLTHGRDSWQQQPGQQQGSGSTQPEAGPVCTVSHLNSTWARRYSATPPTRAASATPFNGSASVWCSVSPTYSSTFFRPKATETMPTMSGKWSKENALRPSRRPALTRLRGQGMLAEQGADVEVGPPHGRDQRPGRVRRRRRSATRSAAGPRPTPMATMDSPSATMVISPCRSEKCPVSGQPPARGSAERRTHVVHGQSQ